MEGNLTTLCGGNKTAAKVGETCLTLTVANDGKLWLATIHPLNTVPEG